RNTNRIQEKGGRKEEVLHAVTPPPRRKGPSSGESLCEAIHQKDVGSAERMLAGLAQHSPEDALNILLTAVEDETEVHRVVLPYRAWDLLGLIGQEQAHTLLRQSVRYCIKAESWPRSGSGSEPRTLLPK